MVDAALLHSLVSLHTSSGGGFETFTSHIFKLLMLNLSENGQNKQSETERTAHSTWKVAAKIGGFDVITVSLKGNAAFKPQDQTMLPSNLFKSFHSEQKSSDL